MQGEDRLFFVLAAFLVFGFGGWFAGILWKKLRPKSSALVRIAIKKFDDKGCEGEDGRFIPWQDVRTIIKEEPAKATMQGASSGVALGGGVVVRYRLVAEGIEPLTHYMLLYISRAWFYFGDTRKIIENRARFYDLVKRFLEIAAHFPHIQFEAYGYSGRDAGAMLSNELTYVSSQTGPLYLQQIEKLQKQKDAVFIIGLIFFLLIAVPLMFFLYKYLVG